MNIGPIPRSRTVPGGIPLRGTSSSRDSVDGVENIDASSGLLEDAPNSETPEGQGMLRLIESGQNRPAAESRTRTMPDGRNRSRPEESVAALVDNGVSDLIDEVTNRVDQLLESDSLDPDLKSNLGDALVVFEGLMRRAQASFLGSDRRSVSELASQLQDALSRLLSSVPRNGTESGPASSMALHLSTFAGEISMLFVSAVARMTDQIVSSAITPPAESGGSGKAYDRFLAGYRPAAGSLDQLG